MRLLDLFCGAGGASAGYHAAGFDVVGVDLAEKPLSQYPFPCIQADAMDVLRGEPLGDGMLFGPPTRGIELNGDYVLDLNGFDVIHASPPCQEYSITRNDHDVTYPDLVPEVRKLLTEWAAASNGRWVIENVPGAPMPAAIVLCGSQWPLSATDIDGRDVRLRRHRLFESNVPLVPKGKCHCAADAKAGRIGGVYRGGSPDRAADNPRPGRGGYTPSHAVARELMGIDWMDPTPLAESIPPAYTQHVGTQVMASWG